jgi:hypothetical protein
VCTSIAVMRSQPFGGFHRRMGARLIFFRAFVADIPLLLPSGLPALDGYIYR